MSSAVLIVSEYQLLWQLIIVSNTTYIFPSSDSSGEETSLSEGEGEGEGEWEGSELVLKKPKISLKGRDDPMAKLLKVQYLTDNLMWSQGKP